MARIRVSTTVDEQLLAEARRLRPVKDAELLDEALRGLVRVHREEWRAESVDGSGIAAGAVVKVVEQRGTRLVVNQGA